MTMLETLLILFLLFGKPNREAVLGASRVTLASRSFSMENRYDVASVNTVFKDNMLLTLRYLDGTVKSKSDISWVKVESPFHYEFTLAPGEVFAFQDGILPQHKDKVKITPGVLFNSAEGFKDDGFLVGDGVCQLASMINWVAKDAGLESHAPSGHKKINDIPLEYGVGILAPNPYGNLYVTNTKDVPVTFAFDFDGTNLTVSVLATNK